MKNLKGLLSVIREARAFLALPDNDFSWSSWENQDDALFELDSIIMKLENGTVPDIGVLFAPTGRIQEVSLSSGWGKEFLKLADRFDTEYAIAKN